MSEFDAADERRRQQDVAQAPQDDDEHARITRQHKLAHCCTIEEDAETSSSADSADMPREAEIWVPSIVSCSRLRLVASWARSFHGCHRWITPVANRPSLRRTPARSRRTTRSESSKPQPTKALS